MKNCKELTKVLSGTIEKLEGDNISPDTAKEISRAASKIIKAQMLQMQYNKAIGNPAKKIDFMED